MGQKETDLIRQAADYENQENLKKAFKCYEKAAKTGDGEILYLCSAKCMKMPFGNAQKKALDWCRESAMLDYADAQLTLARAYSEGKLGAKKNIPRARFWAQQAKYNGSREGEKLYTEIKFFSSSLADSAFFDPGKKDKRSRKPPLEGTCGNAEKQLLEDRDADERELRASRKKSAEEGNAASQYLYGIMIADDNPKEALSWYERSAQNGYTRAKYECGTLYLDGDNVPRDLSKAFHWFEEAAKDGDGDAQLALAKMYDQGNGIQRDQKQALFWYQKAAEQQVTGAQAGYNSILLDNDPDRQADLASRRILVCDSAAFIRKMMVSTLNQAGFLTVQETARPQELLEEYQRQRPDLVFLAVKPDYYEEMLSVLKKISQQWKDAKIILTYQDSLAPYVQPLEQEYAIIADKLKQPLNDTLSAIALKHLDVK